MGVFDDRGETLRGLHLLATLLDLGSPLDAAVPMLARLAETRQLRAAWARVHERLFEGYALSEAALSLRDEGAFPAALVGLIEVGELQGDLVSALRAASGDHRFDPFRAKGLPISPPPASLPSSLLHAPTPRLAATLLRAAIGVGAERVGLFAGSPETLHGPCEIAPSPWAGVWPVDDPEALDERAVVPPIPGTTRTASTSGATTDDTPTDEADDAQRASSARLGPRFDPASLAPHDTLVGALRPDGWHELFRPSRAGLPRLARHCLFRARVPYWAHRHATGLMCVELGTTRTRLPLDHAPDADPPALVIDMRGVYR